MPLPAGSAVQSEDSRKNIAGQASSGTRPSGHRTLGLLRYMPVRSRREYYSEPTYR